MSGGAYEYIYRRIDDIDLEHTLTDPRRAAFQELLKLVAQAMHDIEWVDSCDYRKGEEHEAIDKCFAFMGADPSIITKAHAYDALREQLKKFMEIK